MRLSMAPDQDWVFGCVRRWYFRSPREAPPPEASAAQSAPYEPVLRVRMSLCVLSEVTARISGSPCHNGFKRFATSAAHVKLITLKRGTYRSRATNVRHHLGVLNGNRFPGWGAPGGGFALSPKLVNGRRYRSCTRSRQVRVGVERES
jgi:hypothetical protein